MATPRATTEPTDAFPVTIKHEYGSTVVPRAPQRVVALSNRFRDASFALGVTPLPSRYNDERIYTIPRPWAQYAAGWATSTVLFSGGGPDLTAIAGLKPDLILDGVGFSDASGYEQLSRIAPTIVRASRDSGNSWQAVTRSVGAALGRSARAEQVVAEFEARLTKVASENPRFKGKRLAFASYSDPTEAVYVLDPRDPDMQFFASLGFTVPQMTPRVDPTRFSNLDVDVLIWDMATEKEEKAVIEADPRLNTLRVIKEKRAVYIDGDLAYAFSPSSILSLQFALERITPLLQAVPG
ncbi:MAG: ABC transporter substrate-binding protein [Actinomycetota bacterium]|nr:ABC transporter substrate-binding protein [Actinomycetota bacterium]